MEIILVWKRDGHFMSCVDWVSQAHAPNSCVIIVGTFLDCLGPEGRAQLSHLDDCIKQLCKTHLNHPQSPDVHCIAVSAKTKENIAKLKQRILTLAKLVQVKVDRSTKEHLIGKMVSILQNDLLHILLVSSWYSDVTLIYQVFSFVLCVCRVLPFMVNKVSNIIFILRRRKPETNQYFCLVLPRHH